MKQEIQLISDLVNFAWKNYGSEFDIDNPYIKFGIELHNLLLNSELKFKYNHDNDMWLLSEI